MDKALGRPPNRARRTFPAEIFAFDRGTRSRFDNLPSSKIELLLSMGHSRGIFRIFLHTFEDQITRQKPLTLILVVLVLKFVVAIAT